MATTQRRWLAAALLLGSGVVGWLLAFGVNRGASGYLGLPEGAALVDLSAATEVGGIPPKGPEGAQGPGEGGPGMPEMPPGPGLPGEPGDMAPEAPGQGRGMGSREDFVDPIVQRNIFDSSKVGQPASATEDVGEGGRRTDLKVTLLATVVASPEEFSSALILEDKGKPQGYGVGDPLGGEATILRIEQKKVFIRRNDGAVEYIDMEGARAASEAPSKSAPTDEGGVASSGDNKFVIEKSTLDQALANPEALASQVRVVPHKGADGEVDGYRLSGIRKGTLMEKLGIKNGDIVHSVNGKALTSTSAAMDAYSSMQNERSFTFEISRRNKPQTMEYEVR